MKLAPTAPRVATLLSGGMDSSVLTAIARDDLSAYDTYSSSYPFDGFETNSEQKYALSAANALGTRHTLFAPTAGDFLTGFVEALAAAESPLHHLQSTLLYLLFKVPIPGPLRPDYLRLVGRYSLRPGHPFRISPAAESAPKIAFAHPPVSWPAGA